MKRTNEQSLGDLIRHFLKNFQLEEKVTEAHIMASWEKVMGSPIANYTEKVTLRRKVLTVYLTSSVLRNELCMAKTKIIKMINKELDQEAIEEIIFR
jgi:predicted nucleic acid-binding Zn ribbon protein